MDCLDPRLRYSSKKVTFEPARTGHTNRFMKARRGRRRGEWARETRTEDEGLGLLIPRRGSERRGIRGEFLSLMQLYTYRVSHFNWQRYE